MSIRIVEISLFAVFLMLEGLYAYRLKTLKSFLNRFMLCYWASLIFLIILRIFEYSVSEVNLVIEITLAFISGVFLVVYLLSRGVFVLFEISGEGSSHPTCQSIKKHYVLLLTIGIGLLVFNAAFPLFLKLYLFYKFN
ncbi:MAG: hypothetical protein ACYSSP_02840 [Planctomycetota bacterium]